MLETPLNPTAEDCPAGEPVETAETGDVSGTSRSQVSEVLTAPPLIQNPPTVQESVKALGLEEGYEKERETYKFFQLLKAGKELPDFKRVLRTFTPEMLAVAQTFQNPRLVLTAKGLSVDDLKTAIDSHKTIENEGKIYSSYQYRRATQKSRSWGAHIIGSPTDEHAQKLNNSDDLPVGERHEEFSKYKKIAGVNGMNHRKLLHLAMPSLKEGSPIDSECFSALDEDAGLFLPYIPVVEWDSNFNRFNFSLIHSEAEGGRILYRCSVGGDVPTA